MTKEEFEIENAELRAELERARLGALRNLDDWRKSDRALSKANKANELHYPSKGEFPETSGDMHKDWKPILAYTKELGWTVAMRFKKSRKHEWYCSNYDGNTIFLDEEIIAWKKLPEPPKEIDV